MKLEVLQSLARCPNPAFQKCTKMARDPPCSNPGSCAILPDCGSCPVPERFIFRHNRARTFLKKEYHEGKPILTYNSKAHPFQKAPNDPGSFRVVASETQDIRGMIYHLLGNNTELWQRATFKFGEIDTTAHSIRCRPSPIPTTVAPTTSFVYLSSLLFFTLFFILFFILFFNSFFALLLWRVYGRGRLFPFSFFLFKFGGRITGFVSCSFFFIFLSG